MIKLYDTEKNRQVGEITEKQLQFLIDHLEEESLHDDDYYLTDASIGMLEAKGADKDMVELLRKAVGDRVGANFRWSRE